MNENLENRITFESDRLVEQILRGQKTASACTLEGVLEEEDFDSPLVVGQTYTVYDSQHQSRCLIRVLAMEICRWETIPQRLWEGEANSNADEFRSDHEEYFNHPDDAFEFVAFYFQLVRT